MSKRTLKQLSITLSILLGTSVVILLIALVAMYSPWILLGVSVVLLLGIVWLLSGEILNDMGE